jgi:hypothetical protein
MEEQMKSWRIASVLVGLTLLVAMVPAFAQANGFMGYNLEVRFKVPMAFYAGDKLLPAGEYTVTQTGGETANAILIRGKGKNEAVVQVDVQNSSKPVKETEVTFNKYGDKDYINSIVTPQGGGGTVTQTSFVLKVQPSAGEQAAAKAAAAAAHSVKGTGAATKKQ